MRFHKIEAVGSIHIQRVENLPTWQPSDIGRIVYVEKERLLYYATDEQWIKSSGTGFNPIYVDSNYTADTQDMCLVDTRNGPITITLPSNPKDGGEIKIIDVCGIFESNPCTIHRNNKLLQRLDKNLILDINDLSCSLIYNKLGIPGWSVSLQGTSQIVGNATLFNNRCTLIAENIDGEGGQKQFQLPFKYNTSKENLSVHIEGWYTEAYEKTNTESITFEESIPAGTKIHINSIPLESGFNIDKFANKADLDLYVKKSENTNSLILNKLLEVDGDGSGLDADLLDGKHGSEYVLAEENTNYDILNKISEVDGDGSGLDADLLDGFHATQTVNSQVSSRINKIPVARNDGTIDPLWVPFGRGGIEYVNSFNIPAGLPSVIDITNLDNEAGYIINFKNITPSTNDVSLYLRVYNDTLKQWTTLASWSVLYTSHLSGPVRDFNTNTDMKLADHVGNGVFGINGSIYVTGFNINNPNTIKTIRSDCHFLSSVGNYAALYQGSGVINKDGYSYTGIRLYFNFGNFLETGSVNVLKINDKAEG